MVAVLLQLKFAHFKASFAGGNPWAIFGLIFGGLYGLGVAFGVGALGLALGQPDQILFFLALVGSLLTLAWWLVPLVASAADATLDPERLAPYPITVRQLMAGQALGALIGLPGLLTLLFALAAATSTLATPLALAAYPLSALLGLALAIVGSRLVTVASIPLRARRGVSNTLTLLTFVLLMFTGPLILAALGGLEHLWTHMPQIIGTLQFTPLASAWAITGQVAQGNYGLAAALTLLTLIYLALAWFLWQLAATKAQATVGEQGQTGRSKDLAAGKLGLLGRFPATVRGAIAARTVQMMIKDPRCNVNLISLPIFYLLFLVFNGFTFSPSPEEEYSSPIMGVIMVTVFVPAFAGYIITYLVPYENTAFALHTTTSLRGIDDRLGRIYGITTLYLPMILLGTIAFSLLSGIGSYALPMTLLAVAVFGIGLGIGAYTDTVFSLPVPPPGSSPWKTPKQPDGMAKGFVRGLIMLIPMGLGLPGLIGLAATAITGQQLWAWLGVGAVALISAGVLTWGIRAGAHRFEHQCADMLQRVTRFS